MQIINILKRWEYLLCLMFFLTKIFTIMLSKEYVPELILVNVFKFNFASEIIYYLYCIFLESEFESKYIKILQIRFEKRLFFVTIMINLASITNIGLYYAFPAFHINYIKAYKLYRNNINSEKNLELYNINEKDTFPYHYICSYNPENEILPNKLKSIYYLIPKFKCTKFKLINNNKAIQSFIKKYELNHIYHCGSKDRKKNLFFFGNSDYYDLSLYLVYILMTLYTFLCVKHLELVNVYFKNIKANVINMIILDD